jgi:hypothetical protein
MTLAGRKFFADLDPGRKWPPRKTMKRWYPVLALVFGSALLLMTIQPLMAKPRSAENLVHTRSSSQRTFVSQGFANFTLRGTNGYRIWIGGSSNGILLQVTRRHEAALYLGEDGIGNQNGIHADLGDRGRIDLRFIPTKRIALDDECSVISGELPHRGYFRGTIMFKGEHGFTFARRQKVYGEASGPLSVRCSGRSERRAPAMVGRMMKRRGPRLETGVVTRSFRSFDIGRNAFSSIMHLVKNGVPLNLDRLPRAGVPYLVQTIEFRTQLLVQRVLVAKGPRDGFSVAADGTRATVKPPKPFSGEAEYRSCAKGPIWRGSLRVSLPGIPNMALAGKKFYADLTPEKKCPPEKR